MHFRSLLAALPSTSLAAGCAGRPHTPLHAPAPDAAAAERLAAYDSLHADTQTNRLLVNKRGHVGLASTVYGITQLGNESGTVPFVAGVGLTIVGGGVGILVSNYYGSQVNDEKISAFATYDRDLRKRLDLCVDGIKIVACGAPAAPAAEPSPVAPAPAAPAPGLAPATP